MSGSRWRVLYLVRTNVRYRNFSIVRELRTDGVFSALTEMRVKTPWIEALRQKQKEDAGETFGKPALPFIQADRKLAPKRMADSHHAMILPLGRDPWLLDNYLNANGHVRLGSLFMDLDALSGIIAYKHTGELVTTVTAAVDRITIKNPLKDICDLQLSGKVTYATGRSSMEIGLQVARAPLNGESIQDSDVLLTCTFTMVSLDPATKRPVNIAPLLVETEEERRLFALGEKNYQAKKALGKVSLRKQHPNEKESAAIHNIWLQQLSFRDPKSNDTKPGNVTYMDKTRMHSAQIMQPQYRNRHNFMIFGGFLLKQTFELAFCCAAAFAHDRPAFLSLDPSTFENPVPVGSVLYLTATVAYTEKVEDDNGNFSTRMQIRVDSRVRDVEHGATKPTGQFNYTFSVPKEVSVMPRSYEEFMIWTDATRRVKRVAAILHEGSTNTDKDGVLSPHFVGGMTE
ncbi:hypothetical protein MMC25_003912 [Agyrium rufum]|nr:hypothetical protein [Agyrium rufum]